MLKNAFMVGLGSNLTNVFASRERGRNLKRACIFEQYGLAERALALSRTSHDVFDLDVFYFDVFRFEAFGFLNRRRDSSRIEPCRRAAW